VTSDHVTKSLRQSDKLSFPLLPLHKSINPQNGYPHPISLWHTCSQNIVFWKRTIWWINHQLQSPADTSSPDTSPHQLHRSLTISTVSQVPNPTQNHTHESSNHSLAFRKGTGRLSHSHILISKPPSYVIFFLASAITHGLCHKFPNGRRQVPTAHLELSVYIAGLVSSA
jgi:hypothetical protein